MRGPRIYTSFAEFEGDERQRRGLPFEPAPQAITPVEVVRTGRPQVTVASLRAEGIIEIGRPEATSLVYVRTQAKLHVFHSTWIPDRQLDDYAVRLAVTWIEDQGMHSYQVAENLGVTETTLRKALAAAGYERLTPKQLQDLAAARAARKRPRGWYGQRKSLKLAKTSNKEPEDRETKETPRREEVPAARKIPNRRGPLVRTRALT
jgi:hypothetical protein